MALYALGDLHLSFQVHKPMDKFGRVWKNHERKIEKYVNRFVKPEDTLVLTGDHTWGRKLAECQEDFAFIERLPGRKILLRGNHDMFWDAKKTKRLNDEFGEARALVLSEPVTRLEAGVPYVLYAESSALTLIYSGTEVSEPLNRNGLQGSFTGINVDKDPGNTALQGKYVFSGNVLRKCAAGSSVGANKAYIDLDRVPVLDEQPAGSLRIQVVSGETSVEAPEILCSEEERVYTLGGLYLGLWGQCRDTLPEGCYLVGGHKVVIR